MGCSQSIETSIPQQIDQNTKASLVPQEQKNNFTLAQIQTKLNQIQQDDSSITSIGFWTKIFRRFENLALDSDQQMQLMEFMFKAIKGDKDKQQTQQKEENSMKALKQKIKKNFDRFEERILMKHKMCLRFFKYVSRNSQKVSDAQLKQSFTQQSLKFNLNLEELKRVASTVRSFCEQNMEAFSFLSLYLLDSINNLYSQKPLGELQKSIQQGLKYLQKQYPATQTAELTKSQNEQNQIDLTQFQLIKIPDILQFRKGFNHLDQLESYIKKKANYAKEEEQQFVQMVKSVCLQKGFEFKAGTKIKSNKHTSAIERTIQKILEGSKKFQSVLKDLKKQTQENQMVSSKQQVNSINSSLKIYVQAQKRRIQQKVSKMLQEQQEIEFTVKDLLRAKCMFGSIGDIIETLQQLNTKVKQKNFSFYEIKNRLSSKTRDLTVILNLPNTRAQLQLALKFDKVSNEFNHKIYELLRSFKFTTITNVQVLNERWCEGFFNSQLKILRKMVRKVDQRDFGEGVRFNQLSQEAESFVQRFLRKEFVAVDVWTYEDEPAKIIEKGFEKLAKDFQEKLKFKEITNNINAKFQQLKVSKYKPVQQSKSNTTQAQNTNNLTHSTEKK